VKVESKFSFLLHFIAKRKKNGKGE